MDTKEEIKEKVRRQIERVKAHMPNVYQYIKDKADDRGAEVWALVRRGMAGEANCFYAFENRCVVGTPFNLTTVMAEIEANLVQFGVEHVAVLAITQGATDGAH